MRQDDEAVVAFDPHVSLRESGALEAIEDLLNGLDHHQRESVVFVLSANWLEGVAPTRRTVREIAARVGAVDPRDG